MGHAEAELATDTEVSIAALFDHEEVGSSSTSGAGSPIMGEAVRRVSTALNAGEGCALPRAGGDGGRPRLGASYKTVTGLLQDGYRAGRDGGRGWAPVVEQERWRVRCIRSPRRTLAAPPTGHPLRAHGNEDLYTSRNRRTWTAVTRTCMLRRCTARSSCPPTWRTRSTPTIRPSTRSTTARS